MSIGIPRESPESFYFGNPEKPLFGCYHAPQSRVHRNCGVVLCYPMVSEYLWTHRIYRQIAVRLSMAGFPVLRFDYYGCGDSGGEAEEGGIRQWCTDISAATDQVKERCYSDQVCLVGMHFGATLATLAGTQRSDVDGLVLWDPNVNGTDYLSELNVRHQQRLFHSHGKAGSGSSTDQPRELLGFPITDAMFAELKAVDLLAGVRRPASKTLIISSGSGVGGELLRDHLESLGTQVEVQHIPGPGSWDANRMKQVPVNIIQAVVAWTSGVYS